MILPVEKQTTYRDVPVPQTTKGMILEEVMNYHSSPDDAVSWLENADNDSTGILTTRRNFVTATTFIGSITSPIKAIQVNQLYNNDNAQVFWQQGRNLLQQPLITTGASTVYTNFFGTSTVMNRYDLYQKRLVMTNYGGTTAIYYHTGNTTNPTTAQSIDTKFPTTVDIIATGFAGRIWGTGSTYSDATVYYTDLIPVGGIADATWHTATQQYITLNAGNESPTALLQTSNILFMFTMNKIFRIFNTNSVDNYSISNVGTVSQESVMRTPYGIFFYHPSGIYAMSETGQTQCISDVMYYLLKRVKPSNQKSVFCWNRDQFIYFYLGNLTGMDSNKYYYIRYNLVSKTWSIGSTKTAILCASSGYLSTFGVTETSTDVEWYPSAIFMSASKLATLDVVNPSTDNQAVYGDFAVAASPSNNIDIDIQTKWYTFQTQTEIGELRYKRINGLAVPHSNAEGITVAVQMDNWDKDEWEVIGNLDSNAVTLFRSYQSSEPFNKCKFRFYGTTYGARVKIGMPTVIQLDDMGYKES